MNFKLLLLGVAGTIIFSSCQKELDEEGIPSYCGISTITVKNGSGNVISLYQFTYDSVQRRPTILHVEDFELGTSKTVYPNYSRDTVYLGLNSFLTLDGSKRIVTLSEDKAAQGLINGDYYYSYNNTGQLTDRLIDDGLNDAIRTNFSYDNTNLTSFTDDIPGFPQSVTGTVSYSSSMDLKGYNQYQFIEFFPELMLYMPLLQLGKTTATPISQIKTDVTLPGTPTISLNTTYSNYTLTQDGWLSGFETNTTIPGSQPIVTKYELQYRCFN